MGLLTVVRNHLEGLAENGRLVKAPEKSFVYLPKVPSGVGADIYFLIAPKDRVLDKPAELNTFLNGVVDEDLRGRLEIEELAEVSFEESVRDGDRLWVGGYDISGLVGNITPVLDYDGSNSFTELILRNVEGSTRRKKQGEQDQILFTKDPKPVCLMISIKAYPNSEIMDDNARYVRPFGIRRKVGRDMVNLTKYKLAPTF